MKFNEKEITFSILAVFMLVIFVNGFMYWQNDVKTPESKAKTSTDLAIAQYGAIAQTLDNDSLRIRLRILTELDQQMEWEWMYEKMNRSQAQYFDYMKFFINLFLLFSVLSLSIKKEEDGLVSIPKSRLHLIIFLTIANLLAHWFVNIQHFDLKQKAHDIRARELLMLRNSLDMNMISDEKAWEAYRMIYRYSPEEHILHYYDSNR